MGDAEGRTLGEDVWRLIIGRLPVSGLGRAACVCRLWRDFAGDPTVLAAAFKAPWKLREVFGRPSIPSFWQCSGLGCFAISHPVRRSDTVAGLAIKYQVQVTEIRRLNNMMSDHGIYARDRILIPVTRPEILEGQTCYIEMDIHSRREMAVIYLDGSGPSYNPKEQYQRAVCRLKKEVFDSMKRSMKLDDETAQYYLSVTGGDFKAAIAELKRDLNWEEDMLQW